MPGTTLTAKFTQILLSDRIGGKETGPSMRKTVFMRLAPTFLEQLAVDLGLPFRQVMLETERLDVESSGRATLSFPGVALSLYEDKRLGDGVKLHITLYRSDGFFRSSRVESMRVLAQKDNYKQFVEDLKNELAASKPTTH